MSDRKATSPYQKYGKASFVYSPLYQMWKESVQKFGASDSRTVEIACRHAKSMRVIATACER